MFSTDNPVDVCYDLITFSTTRFQVYGSWLTYDIVFHPIAFKMTFTEKELK